MNMETTNGMGALFVVGTPIGNLSDMTYRAVETLKAVDFIAAEDTRVSMKLLTHFEIKKPLVSYYEHNLRERGEYIVARIVAGENCAIVSDAGMPCISDPGEDLVALCVESGVDVKVIPGPSAVISGLAVSGLKTARFTFEGFLSTNKVSRAAHLKSLITQERTIIMYEAPHKLMNTLGDLLATLGDRRISVARELTKMYEEVVRTTISGAMERFSEKAPRGEFVLIIEGAAPLAPEVFTLAQAVKIAADLVYDGTKETEACRVAAKKCGFTKSEIYAMLQKNGMEE